MMSRHPRNLTSRSSRTLLIAASLFIVIAVGLTATMRASDNIDFDIGGQIRDVVWDSRLFDGTPGYPGAILWHHNPSGKPGSVNQASFEAAIEASFNTWESVDNGTPEEPLIPVVNFGGQTAVTDPFALDGVNTIAWAAELPGGTLAVTPCWALDLPTTTTTNAQGQTVMPVDGGASIPFPGPPGVTYPIGTIIDCGMRFDSLDTWSTSPVPDPNGFDVQGIATHEGGHFIGISHSTLGDFTAIDPASATMLPLAAPGDDTFRTLEEDDKSSVLRVYARNRFSGPIPQTVGGRAVISLRLLKDGACVAATGLSVVAYRTQSGINGMHRVETFSGSHLRAFTPHQPFDGSVTLNVPPLPPGESYTIYARTLEAGQGELAANRYNYTTINSNLLDPQGQSRTFDQLATVSSLVAGETRNLGDVGILGCTVADPNSQINLVAQSITAPATAYKGGQFAVNSTFRNQGTVAAGAFQVGVYVSIDQTINASDVFTGFSCAVSGLASGAVAECNGSAPVPAAIIPGNYYVGLLVDRQNQVIENTESDNGIAAASPIAIAPNPFDPIVNGSFETGNLAGWTVKELTSASNPNLPLSVHPAGVEYPAATFFAFPYFLFLDYFTSAPTDGQYAALHDFNGDDPATASNGPNKFINRRELYQDVTLPATTTTLQFDYRAAWELFRFNSTLPRTFSVEIGPGGGGPPLLTRTILTAPDDTYEEDTDNPSGGVGFYPPGQIDLTAYRSQTVRLKFVWNIPEPGTGFGFFQLDNIRLNTSSVPNVSPAVAITSPADGASSTLGQSVTFTATATDQEDGNLGGNIQWASNRDGLIGSGGTVTTSTLSLGAHTITASVTDSGGLPASASITFTVSPAGNTAPNVAITSPSTGSSSTFGQSVTFVATATDTQDGNISGNISWTSDRDGPIGSGGTVSTSALTVGTHLITASVTDSGGLPGSAAILFTVNPVATNTPPTVTITSPSDGSSSTFGQVVIFIATAADTQDGNITGNISWTSDRDGALGSGGTVSTSSLTVGTHTITASVTDSGALLGSASIAMTVAPAPPVNTAPAAGNQSVTANEDTSLPLTLSGSDAQQCELQFVIVSGPTHGSLGAITNSGCTSGTPNTDSAAVTYTPAANFNGPDSFTYRVSDGSLTADATVSITVNAVNDAPVAANKSVTTVVGTAVTIVMSATDVDGCQQVFSVVQGPSSGTLGTINDDACVPGNPNSDTARIAYTPDASGIHTFTYKASDGVTDSNTATVTVTVDPAPPLPASVHVGDLDGSSASMGKGSWRATASVSVHDSNHIAAGAGLTVNGLWSDGTSGSGSCTTDATGRCSVLSASIANSKKNATFTVISITNGSTYTAADNHDPDGDSDGGTAISVRKP